MFSQFKNVVDSLGQSSGIASGVTTTQTPTKRAERHERREVIRSNSDSRSKLSLEERLKANFAAGSSKSASSPNLTEPEPPMNQASLNIDPPNIPLPISPLNSPTSISGSPAYITGSPNDPATTSLNDASGSSLKEPFKANLNLPQNRVDANAKSSSVTDLDKGMVEVAPPKDSETSQAMYDMSTVEQTDTSMQYLLSMMTTTS